ncbi:hypothetical protein VOLCADRAFT_96657 [Volvox carteri f. nagariensis]|uniref:Pherophorin domain-containing protein n=1 Tax=Volvox carteri f. nagariensis TaxID=3068 RepID=D8UAP9_VOLCA|nr:uncharacterized protein VOLCADRAFT_96657 [Volvox carteri f. nagariensis]EFJ43192.1 hypothetical protein VOLCADRAFT_96657 [Volvox carteri f. nagariensis]|eukprot:XP_002955767.1 hypothetical protein VOLCADRAFT_96657 [Volvox carteri f. nagariensis]
MVATAILPWGSHCLTVLLLLCSLLGSVIMRSSLAQQQPYGAWNAVEDLNEQHKAVLRFILSGNTAFWSKPAVAYRIGFGTAPWHCIDRCQAQYYFIPNNSAVCSPDCTTPVYCLPGDAARSDPNITCCALSLLDQSYRFNHPPSTVQRAWCENYPPWGRDPRPSVCDFNVYAARGLIPPGGYNDPFLAVSCERGVTTTFYITGTVYRNDTARRIIQRRNIRLANVTRNNVKRMCVGVGAKAY